MPQWMQDLTTGWPMIRANIPTFILIIVLIAGVIWTVFSFSYTSLIRNKDGEIALLTRQRDDYKDKSGGASPDQLKEKLAELAEMSRFTVGAKWRQLSDSEKSNLQNAFRAIPPHRIQVMYSNYRGKELAQSFSDLLKAAGWTDIHFSEGGGLGDGISTGRGNGVAIALKEAIEKSTAFKVKSFGPQESDVNNAYFVAVGINTD